MAPLGRIRALRGAVTRIYAEGDDPFCAARKIQQVIRRERDKHGVYVPRYSDAQRADGGRGKGGACSLYPVPASYAHGYALDVAEFSLDFAMVRMADGTIMQQVQGIPMGDPGMTIGTCGWGARALRRTSSRTPGAPLHAWGADAG